MIQAINNFTITGNISREPEIRTTGNGKKYAFITIAVNGMNKDNADFLSFIIWEKLAENVCKYCHKGDCISAIGYISAPTKDGKTTIQLNADSVTFLHKAGNKAKENKPEEKPFEPASNFQAENADDIFAPF